MHLSRGRLLEGISGSVAQAQKGWNRYPHSQRHHHHRHGHKQFWMQLAELFLALWHHDNKWSWTVSSASAGTYTTCRSALPSAAVQSSMHVKDVMLWL